MTTGDTISSNINLGMVDASGSNLSNVAAMEKNAVGQSGATKKKQPSTSEVMEKLDTMLNRFEDTEKRLDNQEKRNSSLTTNTPFCAQLPKEPRLARHSHNSHISGKVPSMDYL